MDSIKTGNLIRTLRREKGLTQEQLAQQLCVSNKTISKWERGCGCPDPAMWNRLSLALGASVEAILQGDLAANRRDSGNLKHTKYYVCPACGSIALSSGGAKLSCCGRPLQPAAPQKAPEPQKLLVEEVENDWFITSRHPMTKANHIAFVAFATGESLQLFRCYPEWDLQLRLPRRAHGTLLWYSTTGGLFYQLL